MGGVQKRGSMEGRMERIVEGEDKNGPKKKNV